MTPTRPADADTTPSKSRPRTNSARADPAGWTLLAADALLLTLFLALVFLLGVFPMNDTDFWWHLRTGDLIRQTGVIPHLDPYLYGGPSEKPWIDLHWGFEVLISLLYQSGGMVAVNLAKCVVTTLALLILISTRKPGWPLWVMVLAWLPALLVLSGRMYVRPETLTLLYLSIFLAILFRLDRRPWLALILPLVQVLWVNSQGLFVLGPGLLGFALIDAACRKHAFAPERARWWGIVLSATLLTGLACLLNPYGIHGALFPLALVNTMSDPIFQSIQELMPIATFIKRNGSLQNLPLQLHFATLALGALSFLVPLLWQLSVWARSRAQADSTPGKKGQKRRSRKNQKEEQSPSWRLSIFRLLLASAFSVLSFRATRNSHQFAAVMGAVTAWNLAEWAAAIKARSDARKARALLSRRLIPRLASLGLVSAVFVLVASGAFYQMTGEGRTIGLGERPLWFPHQAARFAGQRGMPDRFLCFHNGHAALFEYYNGPQKKNFADARLEVVGPVLFAEYQELDRLIATDAPGWRQRLQQQGNPGLLLDLLQSGSERSVATLLAQSDWSCVWFDPVACLFVHNSYPASNHKVDFLSRHFSPKPATDPSGRDALVLSARDLRNLTSTLLSRNRLDLARPLQLLGHGYAHRALTIDPQSFEAWKELGLLEALRNPIGPEQAASRLRQPFDPLFDLSTLRASADLRRSASLGDDFLTLVQLIGLQRDQGLLASSVPFIEKLLALRPINQYQVQIQQQFRAILDQTRLALGPPVSPASWTNLDNLEQQLDRLLNQGRVLDAVEMLEQAHPPRARSWTTADRVATLLLRLGEPQRARSAWLSAGHKTRPALQKTRVGLTHLIEEQYEDARRLLQDALQSEPSLFEAAYLLTVLETDAGRALAARQAGQTALQSAPDDIARDAVRDLLRLVPGGDK